MKNPSWQEVLAEGFTYDHMANSIWLEHLIKVGNQDENTIFHHILSASTIWVTRLDGVSLSSMPSAPLSQASLDNLREKWVEACHKFE